MPKPAVPTEGMAAPSRAAPSHVRKIPIGKTGFSFTPIPALSYSSDLGFQLGAILDAYWFGDGSTYPKYGHKLTAEACYYTKVPASTTFSMTRNTLSAALRFTASASYLPNTMMAFCGFNGYPAPFCATKTPDSTRWTAICSASWGTCRAPIAGHLGWAAGAAFFHYATGRTRVEKYAGETTLYDLYRRYGIIYDDESGGGSHIELRAGVVYDTRDNEPDRFVRSLCRPAALRLARHHRPARLPLPKRRRFVPPLPAAHSGQAGFRLPSMLAGNGSRSGPLLTLQQNYATLFLKQINSDILGGAISLRGILYNRVVRRRSMAGPTRNCGSGSSISDFSARGNIITNPFSTWYRHPSVPGRRAAGRRERRFRPRTRHPQGDIQWRKGRRPAMSAGLGIKIVMNRNLVLSVEYGIPLRPARDGTNGLYLNMNYLFFDEDMDKCPTEMRDEELWQLFPIILVPLRSSWPEAYRSESLRLRGSRRERHRPHQPYGRTAVPGLTAKPTIDILLEIGTRYLPAYLPAGPALHMETCSYLYTPQPQNPPPGMMA